MKTLRLHFLPIILAAFVLNGCATDPVGKAEQSTHIAAINFDTFLQFELDNRAQLKAFNPAIHRTAQRIRHRECVGCDQNGIRWLETARRFTEAYRLNRTEDNKIQLATIMATIQTALDEITNYFLDPRVAALSPEAALVYKKK